MLWVVNIHDWPEIHAFKIVKLYEKEKVEETLHPALGYSYIGIVRLLSVGRHNLVIKSNSLLGIVFMFKMMDGSVQCKTQNEAAA